MRSEDFSCEVMKAQADKDARERFAASSVETPQDRKDREERELIEEWDSDVSEAILANLAKELVENEDIHITHKLDGNITVEYPLAPKSIRDKSGKLHIDLEGDLFLDADLPRVEAIQKTSDAIRGMGLSQAKRPLTYTRNESLVALTKEDAKRRKEVITRLQMIEDGLTWGIFASAIAFQAIRPAFIFEAFPGLASLLLVLSAMTIMVMPLALIAIMINGFHSTPILKWIYDSTKRYDKACCRLCVDVDYKAVEAVRREAREAFEVDADEALEVADAPVTANVRSDDGVSLLEAVEAEAREVVTA